MVESLMNLPNNGYRNSVYKEMKKDIIMIFEEFCFRKKKFCNQYFLINQRSCKVNCISVFIIYISSLNERGWKRISMMSPFFKN
jgi:hypothetical protein